MNQINLAVCLSIIRLFTLGTLFIQFNVSFSSDPYYDTCLPQKCGDVEITYPFFIFNTQKSYCGYPGFEVSCENGTIAHMLISGDSYFIKQIWYKNQSFHVTNAAFVETAGNNCLSPLHNLTLEDFVFDFSTKPGNIILFQNCPNKTLQQYEHDVVKCGALAMYENDPRLKDVGGKCGGVASVPYEGERGTDIAMVLTGGILLNWTGNNCSTCSASGGQCGFDRSTSESKCFCSDGAHPHQCVPLGRRSRVFIAGPVAAALVLAVIILIGLVVCVKRRRSANRFTVFSIKGLTHKNQNVEAFLKSYGSLAPKRYTYSDIKKMTNSFKHKLGEGGFGSVYKGTLQNGRLVAVKLLKQLKGNGEDFINEVASISRTNHVYVVTLLGFCFDRKRRALIYDFMPNGSLEKFIDAAGTGSSQSLPLETLSKIAIGIAKGLDYLHRGCNTRILHFDIKPHNILLDEEYCPKISDFGLARLCLQMNSTISMFEARGTIGYMAPEVFCRNFGGVSHKSDVYSYGMMVLDMVCGRENIYAEMSSSEMYFPEWIYDKLQLGDEEVALQGINDEKIELERKMIIVSLWCIQTYPSNRPSMSRVVEMLEGQVQSLEMPPNPTFSSLPRSVSGSPSAPILTS